MRAPYSLVRFHDLTAISIFIMSILTVLKDNLHVSAAGDNCYKIYTRIALIVLHLLTRT